MCGADRMKIPGEMKIDMLNAIDPKAFDKFNPEQMNRMLRGAGGWGSQDRSNPVPLQLRQQLGKRSNQKK